MLPTLILPEHLLPFLNSHILQEVRVAFAFRTLKAKLAEEGHHLQAHPSARLQKHTHSYLDGRNSEH